MSVYRGQVVSPHNLTLVTLGDAGVGKTSLINRFCSDTFNEVRGRAREREREIG